MSSDNKDRKMNEISVTQINGSLINEMSDISDLAVIQLYTKENKSKLVDKLSDTQSAKILLIQSTGKHIYVQKFCLNVLSNQPISQPIQ